MIFRQVNDFFLINDIVVEVNSLCGTRTFYSMSKDGLIKTIKTNGKKTETADITIIRNEEDRMLSAYNKKILGRYSDIKKNVLLLESGLFLVSTFDEMLVNLIERYISNKHIDKHFRVCTSTSVNVIKLEQFFDLSFLGNDVREYMKTTRVKSSSSLVGERALVKNKLTSNQNMLLKNYIGMQYE